MLRTFAFIDDKSDRYWNVELEGSSVTTHAWRLGSRRKTRTKKFADENEARLEIDQRVQEILDKGYFETTFVESAPSGPLLDSIEQALTEDPEDLASHAAHADYLMEHNDPRGELIQVQLSLEDPSLTPTAIIRLRHREEELIQRHALQWLGPLGACLSGSWSGEDKSWYYTFRRGWLDHVRLFMFPEAVTQRLAQAPEVRLLRRLEIVYDIRYRPYELSEVMDGPTAGVSEMEESTRYEIVSALLSSPFLLNLKSFKIGFSDIGGYLAHSTMIPLFTESPVKGLFTMLEKFPRLEELCLNDSFADVHDLFNADALRNLHTLQYYYGNNDGWYDDRTVIEALASNPALTNLSTLRLHPGRDTMITSDDLEAIVHSAHFPKLKGLQLHRTSFGEEAIRMILDSGILNRLEVLDLAYGNLTDDDVRLLAQSTAFRNLKHFNVDMNALTSDGIDVLAKTGVEIFVGEQHEVDDQEHLYGVDLE